MTVFVGIRIPDRASEVLVPVGERIAEELGGKPTRPCNFHLTLRFLGEVSDCAPICHAMESTAERFNGAFYLTLNGIGTFRQKKRDIYWAGVRDSEPLLRLGHILGEELDARGMGSERIPFRPHITLCRNVPVGIPELPEIPSVGFRVEKIILFSSEHTDAGVFYREIFQKELRI